MTEHVLKCWPVYFDAILRGEKNFEVRRDDRGFQKGDVLKLCRTCGGPDGDISKIDYSFGTPRYVIYRRITYILAGGQFGIGAGYVVLALEDVP